MSIPWQWHLKISITISIDQFKSPCAMGAGIYQVSTPVVQCTIQGILPPLILGQSPVSATRSI